LACALWPLSCVYRVLFGLRRLGYQQGWFKTTLLPVPVVVVGNLIVGGAGKTPTTLALINLLRENGFSPGVISRGYGRQNSDVVLISKSTPVTDSGDEPLLLHLRSGAPVAVSANRVASAQTLLQHHPDINVIISDDGLQHLRLGRQAQVIVFDERGVGNGWTLPAGPLREPLLNATPPPQSLVVYNAPVASTVWPGFMAQRGLGGLVPLQNWWQGQSAKPHSFEAFKNKPVLAAAGVARPARFFGMLRAQGLSITECPLPDHHNFTTLPWPNDACVIVTEKDAVKLDPDRAGTAEVWVATLNFELDKNFEVALLALVRKTQ
jgi:tetraacyldisaccharide 4'-kinase